MLAAFQNCGGCVVGSLSLECCNRLTLRVFQDIDSENSFCVASEILFVLNIATLPA